MSRLGHYWSMWRRLPADERKLHASRVIERLLRRDPRIRALRLAPDQPRWGAFRSALAVSPSELCRRLRRDDESRGPLFAALAPRAAELVRQHPDDLQRLAAHAETLLARTFDLLGSGPVRPLRADGGIDWHLDPVSGLRWDAATHHLDLRTVRGDGSDVKWPWELSRCQHLPQLGLAAWCSPALRARCAAEAAVGIDDWIGSNPRGLGVNWTCTMDVAIRAFNWLAALASFRSAPEWDDAFLLRLVRSLWTHGRHIRTHLEIGRDGLTSNHYLANVIGLYALGCALPELREAAAWRAFAREALIVEMQRQVLPDGADFERSIPYHCLVAEMFVHAAAIGASRGEVFPEPYRARLALMLELIATVTRPDGTVPQCGDNDDGRLLPLDRDPRSLLALGGRLLTRPDLEAAAGGRTMDALWVLGSASSPERAPAGTASRAFACVGLYVLRGEDVHATVSCGPVGTAGLGNHTHDDLLSLTLWAGGREWIVDPGTGTYTRDAALRNRLRSVAAHATLQLGAREPNAFGPGLDDLFRMTAIARPEVVAWSTGNGRAELVARHDGYSGQDGAWVHERTVTLDPAWRTLVVRDLLAGPAPAEPAFLRWPLAPGIEAGIQRIDDGRHRVRLSDRDGHALSLELQLPGHSSIELLSQPYSPRYGVTVTAPVVVATLPPSARIEAVTTFRLR